PDCREAIISLLCSSSIVPFFFHGHIADRLLRKVIDHALDSGFVERTPRRMRFLERLFKIIPAGGEQTMQFSLTTDDVRSDVVIRRGQIWKGEANAQARRRLSR